MAESLNDIIYIITQGSTEMTLEVKLRFFFVVFLLAGLISIVKELIYTARKL